MIVVMMQPSIFTIMIMTSQGPYRHYVLNLLWILINVLCLALTIYHLNKLYRCNILEILAMLTMVMVSPSGKR